MDLSVHFVDEGTLYLSVEQLDDGTWFVSAPGYPGVWGAGPTDTEAADECIEVWREWKRLV
jgi:predicted RNase H-like HicB family nuclease